MIGREAREAATSDNAQLGRLRLKQHGGDIGEQHHPQQPVAVFGACLDVGREIAGVHVGDGGDHRGAHEGQQRARAARLAGVNARLIVYSAYLICGVCAAAAGIILTADTHTSDPVSEGLYIELDAILAVVIGGGSLSGGRVYLGGAILGALVIQALTTSILTSGLPPEYNLVVKAFVILVVLLLQSTNARAALASAFAGRKR